ncbi:MAG TPA: aldehyde dehydrogenase family protein [Bacteroidetes bacterium]|nr:aldehyde dehydrogenase family protein [Bacteroidota bacterium]
MKKYFQVISPVDGFIYAERKRADARMIEEALSKSEAARAGWRSTPLAQRKVFCEKALRYFLRHEREMAEELAWQMGRPIRFGGLEISRGFKERAEYMMGISDEALADVQVEEMAGFQRFIRREPLGTVLVLAPWNYPYLTSVNAIFPALLAGNTVLLKHSEQTPLCAERYAAAFAEAGLPEGVFQYLHLSHRQVAGVIADPRISYVAFTGSVEGGRAIQQAVAGRFINAGLELGGKDPAYVRADANLETTIENLVDGAFFNSGQSCCGIERIYVARPLFRTFTEGFVEMVKQYVLGNPLDEKTTLGPMVKPAAAAFVQNQIDEAVAKGARALIDPALFPRCRPGTAYLAPQVLVDVDHSMAVMRQESFGPVVGIMPVKDDAEAIRLMNDSPYGLTASLWSASPEAALRIGDQIQTGTFFLNRCDYLDPALAWTGVKNSGKGCTLSRLGFEHLTRPKSFHLRKIEALG